MLKFILALGLSTILGLSTALAEQPFGGKNDVAFAKKLWDTLKQQKLIGPDRINVQPFEGNEPHGSIQQVLNTTITIDGRTALVLVKVNHGGKDVSIEDVYANPNKYLGAYTVMFKREKGYDPENLNWFWAKCKPTGDLDKNPKGAFIAGRFMKGKSQGCIACHKGAGGADLQTLTEE